MKLRIFPIREGATSSESIHAVEMATATLSNALATEDTVIVTCKTNRSVVASREQLRLLDRALRSVVAQRDLHMSRSATDGAIAWAACTTRPIGIDVQSPPKSIDDDLLCATLNLDERNWLLQQPDKKWAFAQLWSGKEAVLKAFGTGLAWPPNQVEALPRGTGWQRVGVAALGNARLAYPDVDRRDGIALAVALNMGHEPASSRR